LPNELWEGRKRRAYGYDAWPTMEESVRNQSATGHPDLK